MSCSARASTAGRTFSPFAAITRSMVSPTFARRVANVSMVLSIRVIEDLSGRSASHAGIGRQPRSLVMARLMRALRRGGDAQGRLDADDGADAGRLKLPACVAEERLHCGGIEPTADLIRA